jgi:hypothetical protein
MLPNIFNGSIGLIENTSSFTNQVFLATGWSAMRSTRIGLLSLTRIIFFNNKEDLKMFGLGMPELIILVPMALLGLGIPVAQIVLIIMMYIKINRIEKMLTDKPNQQVH